MRMSEKCRNNNNSDYPLTSRRTNGGNKNGIEYEQKYSLDLPKEKFRISRISDSCNHSIVIITFFTPATTCAVQV